MNDKSEQMYVIRKMLDGGEYLYYHKKGWYTEMGPTHWVQKTLFASTWNKKDVEVEYEKVWKETLDKSLKAIPVTETITIDD
jgi:hypothetical protein